MIDFKFIKHEKTPDDQYIKEYAILSFNGLEVLYVRRQKKDGSGLFWSTPSVSIMINGEKRFIDAFSQDSRHLDRTIKEYLDRRGWEQQQPQVQKTNDFQYPHGMAQNVKPNPQFQPEENLPF